MKTKKVLSISMLFFSIHMFSQQISDGYAPIISEFNTPLKSGIYQGSNPLGITPDNSSTWQYLFVMRNNTTANNYQLQIASSFTSNDRLFFRKIGNDASTSYASWLELATRGTNNFIGNQSISGNLGIGINLPSARLEVVGDISSRGTDQRIGFNTDDKFTNTSGTIAHYGMSMSKDSGGFQIVSHSGFFGLNFYTNGIEKMTILKNGNIGIGINSPNAKLQVAGDISSSGIEQRIGFNTDDKFTNTSGTIAHYGMSLSKDSGSSRIVSHSGFFGINFYTNGTEKMRILQNGNLGIGTANPTSKLTVAGDINSREVKVTVDAGADFVFENDYNLPSLDSVHKYIKENKHLPEIASADEMKKDGINLSEMNIKLLQKVEELTLYVIEQNKRLNKIETENTVLKNRLNKIETK